MYILQFVVVTTVAVQSCKDTAVVFYYSAPHPICSLSLLGVLPASDLSLKRNSCLLANCSPYAAATHVLQSVLIHAYIMSLNIDFKSCYAAAV